MLFWPKGPFIIYTLGGWEKWRVGGGGSRKVHLVLWGGGTCFFGVLRGGVEKT